MVWRTLRLPARSRAMSPETLHAGMSKRQAHAERQRALRLSHTLSTRLQYAIFKIENGWTRQSLSEVENLYYRRQMNTPKRSPGARHADASHQKGNSKRERTPSSPTLERGRDTAPDTTTYADFWNRLSSTKISPGHTQEAARSNSTSQNAPPRTAAPLVPPAAPHASPPAQHSAPSTYAPTTPHNDTSVRDTHEHDTNAPNAAKRPRLDMPVPP